MRLQKFVAAVLFSTFILFNGLNAVAHSSHAVAKTNNESDFVDNHSHANCTFCEFIKICNSALIVSNPDSICFNPFEVSNIFQDKSSSRFNKVLTPSRAPPFFF
jgi:hypothetical protein